MGLSSGNCDPVFSEQHAHQLRPISILLTTDLEQLQSIKKVIVHAVAPMLYLVTIETELGEILLYDETHQPYRAQNLETIKEMLDAVDVEAMTLRQQSAFDEMIGHPEKDAANTLEVVLSPTRAGC